MAAILDPDRTTDFKILAQGIRKALPSYARPIFIRILSKVDLTGKFSLSFFRTRSVFLFTCSRHLQIEKTRLTKRRL